MFFFSKMQSINRKIYRKLQETKEKKNFKQSLKIQTGYKNTFKCLKKISNNLQNYKKPKQKEEEPKKR